jgi:hypothetical protein
MMERLVSRLFRWLTTSTEYEQYCSMVGADGNIAAQATANCKSCTAIAPAMANKKKARAMSLPRLGCVAKRQAGHSARMR